ncbi:ATP-binding protein [Pengzhenrongella frigida]|uniref:LuxR family transcriptional regulator n=1 Tax=Pengzhenrongella frigida TaxID=1259133 RepID=A0A4Q5MXL0_9MICO|nr:LuxR family transcriptional regulator [Cellulomonas sp. HLT2-17]RYV49673.1 LuxR family transcriptional regulator [Cellulomonas sp. HLT2-17]
MSTDVVGRAGELQAVADFLDEVRVGPAGLVLEGEAGIGKTTLWLTAVEQARGRGYRVLVAHPAAAEAHLSYVSLADLLTDVDAAVLDALAEPQRQAIEAVLLRGGAVEAATGRRATGAALLSVIERLADDGPVLLAIDDLQWVDRSSAGALEFVARRLAGRIGVLGALRTGAGTAAGPALQLPDPGTIDRVSVGPLSLGALHGVLRARLGRSFPRPFMVRIQQISAGNPFYALELARGRQLGGATDDLTALPGTLAQLVQARVDAAPAAAQPALLAIAALADPTVELVQLAVDADPVEVDRMLDDAESCGLLRVDGHRVRFTHPLLAAGVYASAPPAVVRAMHRRLAVCVADFEQRARHLALGALRADPRTVRALDEAAVHARARGAPATAAELVDLALRLGADSPERRIRSARHHFDAGDPVRARAAVEDLVDTLGPGRTRASALALLATVRLHDDSYREAAGYLEQALAEAGDDLRLRVEISVELQFVLVNLGRIRDSFALTEHTVDAAERLADPDLLGKALASSVMIRFLTGQGLDEAPLRRALALEDLDTPGPVMLRPTLVSSLLLAWTGQLDDARTGLLALRQHCLERGEESDLMFTAFHTVIVECWRGNLADARLIAEDTMERALELGTSIPLAIALFAQGTVAAYAGDPAPARRAARGALDIFERGSSLAVTVWPIVTLGFVDVSLGEYEAAVTTLGPLAAAAAVMGYGEPTAAPFAPDAVEALVGAGRLAEAAELVDQLERNGRRLDRPWALALGARGRSLLLAAQGDLDGAWAAAERALVEHERLPMPFERARTLLVLGQVQRRRRQKRAAAVALGDAVRVFDELGTALWAARARTELARVAGPRSATGELTPSERRVAELAATGRTNREVAAVLFISPKTVEANLAHVYRKLGIRSRAELGQWTVELRS